jgi:hypothetical protein
MNEHGTEADDVFVERLREALEPPASNVARDAAFDAALRTRMEQKPKAWLTWAPALAAVAAAVAFAVWPGSRAPVAEVDWLSPAIDEPMFGTPTEDLPGEYQALAFLIGDDDALTTLNTETGDNE